MSENKPKVKLRLRLKPPKAKSSSDASPAKAVEISAPSVVPSPASKNSNSNNNSNPNASRGKELPAAVRAAQQASKKHSSGGSSLKGKSSSSSKPVVAKSSSAAAKSSGTKSSATKSAGTKSNAGRSGAGQSSSSAAAKSSATKSAAAKTTNAKSAAAKVKKQTTATGSSTGVAKSKSKVSAAAKANRPSSTASSTAAKTKTPKTVPASAPAMMPFIPPNVAAAYITSLAMNNAMRMHVAAAPPPPPPPPPPPQFVLKQEMTPDYVKTCLKILNCLKRRHNTSTLAWFTKPITDANLVVDYRNKIRHPSDITTITNRLKQQPCYYKTVSEFVLDARRIFANALRYNTVPKDKVRAAAMQVLEDLEGVISFFLVKRSDNSQNYPTHVYYQPLLYCWKKCIEKLDVVLSLKNPTDNLQTAFYFLHPVSFFFGGQFPADYLEKIKTPMDFGTVVSKLLMGEYQSVGIFAQDCRLVCENCKKYYADKAEGSIFVEQANRLMGVIVEEVRSIVRSDQQRGLLPASPPTPTRIPVPPKELLRSILKDLRNTSYTSRINKAIMRAMDPFEKPVSSTDFPDYSSVISQPMDLSTIDTNIEKGLYQTPDDFEFDVMLIFDNCEKYNVPKKHIDIVNMAKHGARSFKRIFSSYLKKFESGKFIEQRRPSITLSKKIDSTAKNVKLPIPTTSSTKTSSKAETPKPQSASKRIKLEIGAVKSLSRQQQANQNVATIKAQEPVSSEPVPTSAIIERVKQFYKLRRTTKNLEPWEVACSRIVSTLLRHPWMSSPNSPKFVFHAPVLVLFPEIAAAYTQKISKPVDLTTCEAKLLHGGYYHSFEEFVDDIVVVFTNAITFNKAGHEEGDPTSSAYYEAAQHLLFYTRLLSLENLSGFLVDDLETNSGPKPTGAFTSWEFTKSWKKAAKEEMENIVMNVAMEKSEDVFDRFTWWEQECEKVLKALRHQSDLRYMTYFVHTLYPADYAAYVSKPIDWNDCNRNLQDRIYDTIGMCIEDIRLIFSNALKYNARAQGTETVSGHAYAAAQYMSAKLEGAIDRMLLTVSERLQRDKIDRADEERQRIAAEIAEEEKARAEGHDIDVWRADRERKRAEEETRKQEMEIRQTLKLTVPQRRPTYREYADSDVDSFEDEDEANHEQAYLEAVRRERSLFVKQQKDRKEASKVAQNVGITLLTRLATKANFRKTIESKISSKPDQISYSSRTKMEVDVTSSSRESMLNKAVVPTKIQNISREGQIRIVMDLRERMRVRSESHTISQSIIDEF